MQLSSGDVSVNGLNIHYYRTGGDKPPLVLAHGATDDGLCWSRVAEQLESDFDVILPDARGHGRSDAPRGAYTSSDHAADLAGLIGGLGLDHPAIGGHSMGAGAVLALLGEYPDLVRCAILEDPGLRDPGPPGAPGAPNPRDGIIRMVVEGKTAGRDALIATGRAQSPKWDAAEFGPWADAKIQLSDAFLEWMRGASFGGGDWRASVKKIQRPTLLITSDPELGGIVTPEVAAEAEQLSPCVQCVRLRGAGHNIRREQFDGFVASVRAFLATH